MNDTFNGKEISISTTDGVKVTGDLYLTDDKAPFIILYHQAGFSRGEYRPIAPKLNELGFNCLAIDQRSGHEVNGVCNETKKIALSLNKGTEYIDTIPDIEAAIKYSLEELQNKNIIIWGSSYSASLVLSLQHKFSDQINGILAFSPGEYFKVDNQSIQSQAAKVTCPVFITSAKNEHKQWKKIYEGISTDRHCFLPKKRGIHGSRALWEETKGHEDCWSAVESFLMKVRA